MAPSTSARSSVMKIGLAAALAAWLPLAACDGKTGSGASSAAPAAPSASSNANTAPTGSGDARTGAGPASVGSTGTSSAPTDDPAPPSSGSARGAAASPSAGPGTSANATAAATSSASAAVAQGQAQGNDAYSAWLQSAGKYTAGVAGTVQAVLVAKPGYKCNEKYPYKFKLDPAPAGVSYPETTVRGITYGTTRSTLSIPFVAAQAGSYTVSGTFALSVCNETTCKVQKQALSVPITVAPAK
jgi:hypothetical protein